jgi:hypothetical protein
MIQRVLRSFQNLHDPIPHAALANIHLRDSLQLQASTGRPLWIRTLL